MFAGRLNDADELQTMQALEYRSFFGFGWPKQQLNNWPVGMTTLSEFPNTYMQQRLSELAATKLSQPDMDNLNRQYIADAKKIQTAVDRLEKTYNPETQCLPKKK